MLVKTRWPALIPAIKRAGHEPVLVFPLADEGIEPIHNTVLCEGFVLSSIAPDASYVPPPRPTMAEIAADVFARDLPEGSVQQSTHFLKAK